MCLCPREMLTLQLMLIRVDDKNLVRHTEMPR